jgi:predicted NBD/HSP70 family sugar kinase
MSKGININNLKNQNRSALLYLLNAYGSLSRKEIAKKLNLTPAAITKIVSELINEKYIKEGDSIGTGLGRKEVLVSLDIDDKLLYGINVEQDVITLSFSSMNGKLLTKKVIPFDEDFSKVLEEAKQYYYQNEQYKVEGISICIIGHLHEFGVWQNVDYKQAFEEAFQKEVIIENNVKAFALSSLIYDNKEEAQSLLFFKWGPGIGSSIVTDGKVVTGSDYGIAEIGHYIINPKSDKKCRCGRYGCLENETSLKEIVKEVKELGYHLSIEEILKSQDDKIKELLDRKIDLCALALVNTATILNVSDIVLFGSLFKVKSFADKFINRCIELDPILNKDSIRVSSLNEDSGYIGACAIGAKKLFFEKGNNNGK